MFVRDRRTVKLRPGDPDDLQPEGTEPVLPSLLAYEGLDAFAVFHPSVELDDSRMAGEVQVDTADEAGRIAEHGLQLRLRQSCPVHQDPQP